MAIGASTKAEDAGNRETQLPSAPSLGWGAPYTRAEMRDCRMAPAPVHKMITGICT